MSIDIITEPQDTTQGQPADDNAPVLPRAQTCPMTGNDTCPEGGDPNCTAC